MEALILVDIQNDFLPGGALAVPQGDQVIAVANQLIQNFNGLIVATWDWHPPNHGSFASQHAGRHPFELSELFGLPQVLWPDHCVAFSGGALFPAGLETRKVERIIVKGTDPTIDSYSGFFDNGQRKATELESFLRGRGVNSVQLLGLATDYCVKATTLDALRLGFKTSLVVSGCRAVNLTPGDGERALQEMGEAGARLV